MKHENFIFCRSFSICYGSASPNEVFLGDYSKVLQRNLCIYVYQGSGTITSSNGLLFECNEQNLVDLQSITGGMVENRVGSNGGSWVCVNNNYRQKEFNFELLNTPVTKTVIGSLKETYLLCLDGSVTCNGVPISERNYARIKNDSEAQIVVPESAVAILMTEK
jgi:hypothetical protein